MADKEFNSGLVRLHVLHHAARGPIYGLWMIHELNHHGYRIGPGTMYPLLHRLEQKKYLKSRADQPGGGGQVRRSYTITPQGRRMLARAKVKVRELFDELFEDEPHS